MTLATDGIDVPASQPPRPAAATRDPALDGLRAVAALLVVATHVSDASTGSHSNIGLGPYTFHLGLALQQLNLGVEVFFVISAFLVYRPFLAANVDGGERPEPLRFWWRRALRIYPAYWAALLIIVGLSVRKVLPTPDARLAHALLVYGYDPRYYNANFGLRQSWTLVVEISFYAFVPIWAWMMRGLGRRVGALRAEVLGAAFLVPLGPALLWYYRSHQPTPTPLRVLPEFLGIFAWGMLLAAVDVWHERRRAPHPLYEKAAAHPWWWWGGAAVVFLAFVQVSHINPLSPFTITGKQQVLERVVHGLVAFGLVGGVVIGRERRSAIRSALRLPPLVFIGVVSYGFYLWHYVFIDFLHDHGKSFSSLLDPTRTSAFVLYFVITVVGATILGALSWVVIERPLIAFSHGRGRLHDRRFWRRWKRPTFYQGLVAIAVGALVWRVYYVITNINRLVLNGDAYYYHNQANDIAHGRWFIDPSQYDFYGRVTPSAGHPPNYILYLAAVSKFIGGSETTHRLASTLLGAGAVFFVGVLARQLFRDDRVGWVAAGIAAVYAHMWINDEMLMSEGMYQLWAVISVILAYRFWRRPTNANAAWMGFGVAMAALSRAEASTLFLFLVVPLVWVIRQLTLKRRITLVAVACLVGALTMAPWVLYNLGRFVHPVVTTNGIGSTLMVANCDQTYHGFYTGYWYVGCAKNVPILQKGDESEKEVVWRKIGLDYIKAHKREYPRVTVLRVLRMWDLAYIGQNIHPLNDDLEGRGAWASLLATLQYIVIAPLAVHGLILLRRRGTTLIPFLAYAFVITVTAAFTFGITRYRAPVDALLPVFAAAAVVHRLDRSRRPRRSQAVSVRDGELAAAAVAP